jgi:hypothetical protein
MSRHPRMTRREIAAPDPLKEAASAVLGRLLNPEPGKMLPAGYVVKRRRDGKNGPGTGRWELGIVRRDYLTIPEREMHIRRLRKTRKLSKQPMAFSEADALEAETLDLITSGELRPAADAIAEHGGDDPDRAN